jgi:voltage-gated potassium channel
VAETSRVRLPHGPGTSPLAAIGRRFLIAIGLVLVNWGIVLIERSDYRDTLDGHVSVIDALYYTTVTLSTTGYGDITPATQTARLVNALAVTPMRLLFVLVLVGTTIQVLTERSREAFRLQRWRNRLNQHVVVIGFGTKGRSAVRELIGRGAQPDDIVVIDPDPGVMDEAHELGLGIVVGDATKDAVLRQAEVPRARAVVVATARDDAAVLATLSSRRLAPKARITASVREAENEDLVRQSGADAVVISSAAAGRLLGMATTDAGTVEVLEDLLSSGSGLDLVEREVTPEEMGRRPQEVPANVLAVVRGGRTMRYDDDAVGPLATGDRVVCITAT